MKSLHFVLMILAVSIAQTAVAHTELSQSIPADRAMLEAAPEQVVLHFSEPVRLTALSVQKDSATKQSLGPLPTEAAVHFVVAAPMLDDGHYMVSWRALSEDTHVMTGSFMFVVGARADHAQMMNHGAADDHASMMNHGAADDGAHAGHTAQGDHADPAGTH